MKVIALKTINTTAPGGELDVSPAVAKVLVLLGNARYADEAAEQESTPAPAPERARRQRRAAPLGEPVGGMTKPTAAE